MTSFSLSFFKGDTPTIVVSLDIAGHNQSLNNYFAKLYILKYELLGDVQGTNASFFIDKNMSLNLSIGQHKVWLEFTSPLTKYSYQGIIRVERARV